MLSRNPPQSTHKYPYSIYRRPTCDNTKFIGHRIFRLNRRLYPQLAMPIWMQLNKNFFNPDLKTLRNDELRTLAGSTFGTVGATLQKACFTRTSMLVEGTVANPLPSWMLSLQSLLCQAVRQHKPKLDVFSGCVWLYLATVTISHNWFCWSRCFYRPAALPAAKC